MFCQWKPLPLAKSRESGYANKTPGSEALKNILAESGHVGGPLLKTLAFSASAADRILGVADGQGHGLFTYFLLRGLNETRGTAKAKDLFSYRRLRIEGARFSGRTRSVLKATRRYFPHLNCSPTPRRTAM